MSGDKSYEVRARYASDRTSPADPPTTRDATARDALLEAHVRQFDRERDIEASERGGQEIEVYRLELDDHTEAEAVRTELVGTGLFASVTIEELSE